MSEEPTICVKCKHCLVDGDVEFSTSYFCMARTRPTRINCVTGKESYLNESGCVVPYAHPWCYVINTDGQCKMYEETTDNEQ